MLEELLGGDEVRQAGEELSHVDEVHAGQDVLVETQQAQCRAEQELLIVSAEHIPHPTRQVQRQRLAVQSEDPGGTERQSAQHSQSLKTDENKNKHMNILTFEIHLQLYIINATLLGISKLVAFIVPPQKPQA